MRKVLFFPILVLIVYVVFVNFMDSRNQAIRLSEIETELLNKARIYLDSLPPLQSLSGDQVAVSRVALGEKLFRDIRLSKNETKSCNSCHVLENYGVDNEPTSPGFRNVRGSRNTPSVYNATFALAQFWDGRAANLKEQAKSPIFDKVEMGMPNENTLIARLAKDPDYEEMFTAAFPDSEQALTLENLTTAIEAFEQRLVTYSRFDNYLDGDINALTEKEKRGLNSFIDRGCIPCHSGSATGGNMYQAFPQVGQMSDYTGKPNQDLGRYDHTNLPGDKKLFKVPSLRNVARTAPYFHDGSVADLPQAVKIMAKAQLNTDLPEEEVEDIVAFLHALTGELPIFESSLK